MKRNRMTNIWLISSASVISLTPTWLGENFLCPINIRPLIQLLELHLSWGLKILRLPIFNLFLFFSILILLKPAFQNLLGVDERKKFENLTLWYSGLMEDEKLKKHFKVQLTDKRKEFNAADIKVTYEQIKIYRTWVQWLFFNRDNYNKI